MTFHSLIDLINATTIFTPEIDFLCGLLVGAITWVAITPMRGPRL